MQLKNNEVHIWLIEYDNTKNFNIWSTETLSKGEVDRVKRFKHIEVAKAWAFFHSALRDILSRYVGFSAVNIKFSLDNRQKPYLKNLTDSPVYFNLSHSGNVALLAVTGLAPIGIDIEVSKEIQDADGVAKRFFSEYENAQLRKFNKDQFMHNFYRIWTSKEAVIKANGWGMSASLDSFDVLVEKTSGWFSPVMRNLLADTGVYWVKQLTQQLFPLKSECAAAVCLNITKPQVIDYFDINRVILKEMLFENDNL
jgi:phosphopantetheinyl transferase